MFSSIIHERYLLVLGFYLQDLRSHHGRFFTQGHQKRSQNQLDSQTSHETQRNARSHRSWKKGKRFARKGSRSQQEKTISKCKLEKEKHPISQKIQINLVLLFALLESMSDLLLINALWSKRNYFFCLLEENLLLRLK